MALTVGGLATTVATTASPASAAPPIPSDVTYQLVAGDFCVSGRGFNPGPVLRQDRCGEVTNSILRRWVPENVDGGSTYRLRNWANGLCMAIGGGRTDVGAKAIQWGCAAIPDQMWRIEPVRNGFQLVNVNIGLCLMSLGQVPGELVEQRLCSEGFSVWTFRPV